ncbi:MAG: hypothetical protein QM753_07455, partial [Thermomicrobiales bacterium]
ILRLIGKHDKIRTAPPNAAIVTTNSNGEDDVLVVELTEPSFDADKGELSYAVSVMEKYEGDGLAFAASQQQDLSLSQDLGKTSLFIDDCPYEQMACWNTGYFSSQLVGYLDHMPYCWDWKKIDCEPCHDYSAVCNETFPEGCGGECKAE